MIKSLRPEIEPDDLVFQLNNVAEEQGKTVRYDLLEILQGSSSGAIPDESSKPEVRWVENLDGGALRRAWVSNCF